MTIMLGILKAQLLIALVFAFIALASDGLRHLKQRFEESNSGLMPKQHMSRLGAA